MTDVPHFDAAFATSVDMTGRIADGDSTYHLPVGESIDLSCMARDARAYKGIRGKRYRLHLSISAHMKGVGSGGEKRNMMRKYGVVRKEKLRNRGKATYNFRRVIVELSTRR